MRFIATVLSFGVLLSALFNLVVPAARAQDSPPAAETVVQPALDGIFEAFKHHPLVGIGDDHGISKAMDFYIKIIRDSRFAPEVGNVVVEFGAGGRQDIIDSYVAGETVPYTTLRMVWTDTVGWNPTAGWLGFAEFYAAVRDSNKSLPPEKRIKVWLGEPPIDWSRPGNQMIDAVNDRDSYPAGIIEREILDRGEKALVIYGGFHFGRGGWLRGLIEAKHPNSFYVALGLFGVERNKPGACASLLKRVTEILPTPAIAAPAFGTAPDATMRKCATLDARLTTGSFTLQPKGSMPVAPQPNAAQSKTLFVEAEAVLFVGPLETLRNGAFLPDYLFDAEYRREMARRAANGGPQLVRFPPGWVFRKVDYAIDLDAPGYAELIDAMFNEYDKNRDGVVTREEYVDPIPM